MQQHLKIQVTFNNLKQKYHRVQKDSRGLVSTTRRGGTSIPCKKSPLRAAQPREHLKLRWFSLLQLSFLKRCRHRGLKMKMDKQPLSNISCTFHYAAQSIQACRTWSRWPAEVQKVHQKWEERWSGFNVEWPDGLVRVFHKQPSQRTVQKRGYSARGGSLWQHALLIPEVRGERPNCSELTGRQTQLKYSFQPKRKEQQLWTDPISQK